MSNVEGMYSVYFIKKTEQSDSTIRQSSFYVVSHERGLRLKDSRSDQKRNFWELVPNSAVVGFRIS
ncbi:hypothetical protein D1AOALGA4SA_1040 [Olavius algarvensis Delta 1 endosymbiont]|nr:hypothetical protein D1AOALGA4SA_1040 [Olavius algarvensis Delta 1 endosymbiont]